MLRYCAAKDEKYYGFKVHLLISYEGVITGFTLTPANGSEVEALWEISSEITGLIIGDKDFYRHSYKSRFDRLQF
ncbi:MAG: transposase [Pleurocapsa sp.]